MCGVLRGDGPRYSVGKRRVQDSQKDGREEFVECNHCSETEGEGREKEGSRLEEKEKERRGKEVERQQNPGEARETLVRYLYCCNPG